MAICLLELTSWPFACLIFKAENHVTLRLFCSCIRTEQVIKLFTIFLIVFIRSEGIFMCFYATRCISLYKDFDTLLEFVWKNTASM